MERSCGIIHTVDPLFRWIESSTFSIWTRESTSVLAYPTFLSAHAIGMGLAVGVSLAVALHLLGVAPSVPTRELRRLSIVLWIGVVLNGASGVVLLIAYPTKALTNPVFYLKLSLVALGTWSYVAMHRRLDSGMRLGGVGARGPRSNCPLRWIALTSLASWVAAITAGRLLAYTYHRLFVDF